MEAPIEVTVSPAGDPFYAAGITDMTPSQRDKFLREYYAPECRMRLRRIMQGGCDEPEEEENE